MCSPHIYVLILYEFLLPVSYTTGMQVGLYQNMLTWQRWCKTDRYHFNINLQVKMFTQPEKNGSATILGLAIITINKINEII